VITRAILPVQQQSSVRLSFQVAGLNNARVGDVMEGDSPSCQFFAPWLQSCAVT
jgi:hypothetical protein